MSGLEPTSVSQRFGKITIENRPFINGAYCLPDAGGKIEKTCPANGKRIPALHACAETDVDNAVRHADNAYQSKIWRSLSKQAKQDVMFRLAELIEAEAETLAYLDTLETGRAYANFTLDSIPKAVKALRWFAEGVDKYYEHLGRSSASELAMVTREPLGTVGIITPWNDPLVVSMWKLAPALLMGNSVIIKPAEQSSYSMIRIAALAKDAGIPDGVLNVLPGLGHVAGRAIAMHMDVRGIFFTGSSSVGKEIIRCTGASNMKKVGLECGGKSAFLVSDQCSDLKAAAMVLSENMFYNQGQICSAPSRAILHEDIEAEFIQLLLAELPKYQPGNPFDPTTRIGAISSYSQFQKISGYIDRGVRARLDKITGDLISPPCMNGYYLAPTVFRNVPPECELACEEIFGPVLVTHTVADMQSAISIANGSTYGLAASIWSNNIDEALQCATELEAGIVHVNCYGDDDNSVPFGGIKQSGIGRDKSLSAFDEYSYAKTTWVHFANRLQRKDQ